MRIRNGRYKDVAALVMENTVLRVALLPDFGGKIASIFHKPTRYETLYQNPGARYRKTRYADSYLAGELSGFDDMFPTISECCHEAAPWKGIVAPDHGEVWSLPCACRVTSRGIQCVVHGVRFPYRLEKTVTLAGDALRVDYRATNLSPHDLDFIWAAHPMFRAHPGTELEVPAGLTAIINSVPGGRLGPYGARYDFPVAALPNGHSFDLRRVPALTGTSTQKYWFAMKNTAGWCGLVHQRQRVRIRMQVPPREVPYLGVFVDEGGITGKLIMAPEPATAAMDRIDASKLWGMGSVLPAHSTRRWSLSIAVSRLA